MIDPVPAGMEGLIPHLVCSPCTDAIEFYQQAFGAREVRRLVAPDGQRIMHAELRIGDLPLFVVDDFPEFCGKSSTPIALGGTPVTIHRYVEDCDAAVARAVEAGAKANMPVSDMFWGDRYGSVTDPFGHTWSLATHKQDLTPDEVAAGMRAAFQESGSEC